MVLPGLGQDVLPGVNCETENFGCTVTIMLVELPVTVAELFTLRARVSWRGNPS